MSKATVTEKVARLIEKAQTAGGEGVITYPEFEFVRPTWWLPRPTLTEGNNVREVWLLHEVPAEFTEHRGFDLTSVKVLPNNKKQFWEKITYFHGDQNHFYLFNSNYRDNKAPYAIEMIINSNVPICIGNRYTMPDFQNLRIICGTALGMGWYKSGGLTKSHNLRVIENLAIGTNRAIPLCQDTGIIRAPKNITVDGDTVNANEWYKNCKQLRDGGYINAQSMQYTFQNCYLLDTVSLGANCAGLTISTFSGCSLLRDIKVEKGFSSSLYIQNSTLYTTETLHTIIENLADMSEAETAPTFQVGGTNLAKIDENHIIMLDTKGWLTA